MPNYTNRKVLRFKAERLSKFHSHMRQWMDLGDADMGTFSAGSRMGAGLSHTLLKMSPAFEVQRIYYDNAAWSVVRVGDEWMATKITNETKETA
jgi:hypothetical protein